MFDNIRNIQYDIDLSGRPVDAKNIFTYAYILKKYMRNNRNVFDYVVVSGDSPESLAYKYYGDPKMSWVILMANDIKDVYSEWPANDTTVQETILAQYKPEVLPYKTLKRIDQLEQIPKEGFDGQVIYVENVDKTYEWASGTSSWNFANNGLPKASVFNQEFTLTLNDYHLPTATMLSTKSDPKPVMNKTIIVYRNHKSIFNVWFSNITKFYLATSGLGPWKSNSYKDEDRDGLSLSRLGNGITTWDVPANAPDYIYYHCSDRPISGLIKVVDSESKHYVDGMDGNSLDGYSGRASGNLAKVKEDWYIWNGKYIDSNTDSFRSGWTPLVKDRRTLPIDIAKNTPVHYIHNTLGYKISNESFSMLEDVERLSYTKFSSWDEKHANNEKFREIKIIRREIVDQFVKDWKRIIK